MSRPSRSTLFDLRSGAVDAVHLVVRTADFAALREALQQRFASAPEFFSGEVVAIDLRRLPADAQLPLDELAALLRELRMRPLGVVALAAQQSWATSGELPLLDGRETRKPAEPSEPEPPAAPPEPEPVAAAPAAAATAEPPPATAAAPRTLLVDRPLRSGQRVYSSGDLIVRGVVSHGAEVMAEGNVHVYGSLRGRALAGARGNAAARIFCTSFEPELVAIAGIYRTAEQELPAGVRGQPAMVRLHDDKLLIEPLTVK